MKLEKSRSFRKHGFTLIEVFIVLTIVALLATIAISNFIIARDSSRLAVIRTNLHQIESAKEQWAIENNKVTGATVGAFSDLDIYLRNGQVKPVVNETYDPHAVGTPATALLPVKLGPYSAGEEVVAQ